LCFLCLCIHAHIQDDGLTSPISTVFCCQHYVNKSKTRRGVSRRATQNKTPNNFTNMRSYAGMKVLKNVELRGNVFTVTTAAITGVAAAIVDNDVIAQIGGWATRFGSTFDEYRVESVTWELMSVGLNTGMTVFFITEQNLGTPTLSEAQQREGLVLKNNVQPTVTHKASGTMSFMPTIKWVNRDFEDQTWRPITVSTLTGYLSIYTNSSNYGSPVSTVLWICRPTFNVSFRGLRST
jgi:hypothetical protein